ncbi:MAG: biotin synthase BioB [Thermoguttaceae bacterium]|nr:biotin synthase BioB [Thermoguttaceae bacterium]MDW8039471.1 biotin synthase BioB [Thermoguttaceae bacterium]
MMENRPDILQDVEKIVHLLQSRELDNKKSRWQQLADRVLAGHRLSQEEALEILQSPEDQLVELLSAAYRLRRHYFGHQVQVNFLINAKSGLCGEDCAYCSQSAVSKAPIPKYPLVSKERILQGAELAMVHRANTYCIAISGRSPADREVDQLAEAVRQLKSRYPLKVCVSIGLLSRPQADRLKQAGVDRINHNLNTSARFYPRICTTHSYQDRLATLEAVRAAGLEICCGGLLGMGEKDEDVVDLALELARLEVAAIPINFLNPIPGTPLEGVWRLTPRYCLKALCLFRFAVPKAELRMAAGREIHLGPLQPLGLYPANSLFVGGYLTTRGRDPQEDFQMIEALGFEVVSHGVHLFP